MKIKVLLLLFALFITTNIVYAANWVTINNSKSDQVYFDKEGIKIRHSKIYYWAKIIPNDGYFYKVYSVSDCDNDKIAILYSMAYDSKNKLIDKESSTETFKRIIPNSNEENLSSYACNLLKEKTDNWQKSMDKGNEAIKNNNFESAEVSYLEAIENAELILLQNNVDKDYLLEAINTLADSYKNQERNEEALYLYNYELNIYKDKNDEYENINIITSQINEVQRDIQTEKIKHDQAIEQQKQEQERQMQQQKQAMEQQRQEQERQRAIQAQYQNQSNKNQQTTPLDIFNGGVNLLNQIQRGY